MKTKYIREHEFSDVPGTLPRCIHCGADEDDAFVGNEECVRRRVKQSVTDKVRNILEEAVQVGAYDGPVLRAAINKVLKLLPKD